MEQKLGELALNQALVWNKNKPELGDGFVDQQCTQSFSPWFTCSLLDTHPSVARLAREVVDQLCRKRHEQRRMKVIGDIGGIVAHRGHAGGVGVFAGIEVRCGPLGNVVEWGHGMGSWCKILTTPTPAMTAIST